MGIPRRIQRRADKGWRLPANTVYVGRGTKWGNPFPFAHQRYLGKAWAVEAYEQWLTATLPGMRLLREHLHELRGKNLACWERPDEPSHADILLALANEPLAHAEEPLARAFPLFSCPTESASGKVGTGFPIRSAKKQSPRAVPRFHQNRNGSR